VVLALASEMFRLLVKSPPNLLENHRAKVWVSAAEIDLLKIVSNCIEKKKFISGKNFLIHTKFDFLISGISSLI